MHNIDEYLLISFTQNRFSDVIIYQVALKFKIILLPTQHADRPGFFFNVFFFVHTIQS